VTSTWQLRQMTLAQLPGDYATATVGDGEGAVRLARTATRLACDIETAGLYDEMWDVRAVTVADTQRAYVLDPHVNRAAIIDALAAAPELVFHNAPFDVPVLCGLGFMSVADVAKVNDTLVSARLAMPSDKGGRGLGQIAVRYLGADYDYAKKHAEAGWREVTGLPKAEMFRRSGLFSEAYCIYAAMDAILTARLVEALPAAVARHTADHPFRTSGDAAAIVHREQTINRLVLARSCRGIELDFDVIDELRAEMRSAAIDADAVLRDWDIDTEASPVKVKETVVARLDQLEVLPSGHRRLNNGNPSADKRQLAHVTHPIVDALNVRSMAERFQADYLDKMLRVSRGTLIHPQVAVAAAVTGRMSYSVPPLQQYPKSIRRMMRFPGPAVSLDWSSIEPVLFANLTGETALLEHFEAGGDIYEPVAAAAGVTRKTAKVVLLAQLYGQGARALGTGLGLDENETKALVAKVMDPLTEIRAATRAIRNLGDRYGRVQTLSLRVCPIDPDPASGNHRYIGYKGVNYVVQGSAYDLLAEALLKVHETGLGDEVYAVVHDEIVVSATAADEVEHIMRTPPPALVERAGRTPILRVGRAELGTHWIPTE
jgi:DNA polymerase I